MILNKNIFNSVVPIVFSLGVGLLFIIPVDAETIYIEDKTARSKSTKIDVSPGKATGISFGNNEKITFVLLSDQSKNVYTPNAPIDSGRANVLFLRQIENLDIPGTTTTERPNLFVVTINSQSGETNTYEFIINNQDSSKEENLVVIEPTPEPTLLPEIQHESNNIISTSLGKAAPEDLELGLETELKRGNLDPENPLVFSVAECIALLYERQPLQEVLQATDVPLSLLKKLGETGLAEKTRRRMQPLPFLLPTVEGGGSDAPGLNSSDSKPKTPERTENIQLF